MFFVCNLELIDCIYPIYFNLFVKKYTMKKSWFVLMLISLILITNSSCEKFAEEKPFNCDTAYVVINNPSDSLTVIFGYNTNILSDTIHPGGSFVSKYYGISNTSKEIFTMFTEDGGFTVEVSQCNMEFNAINGYVNLKNHCYDGRFQPKLGELNTDCGGYCNPCPALILPCTVAENYVNFTAISGLGANDASLSYTSLDAASGPIINEYELSSGASFRVTFYLDSLPKKTRKFITGTDDHNARLILNLSTGTYIGYENQELYFVKKPNGEFKLSFCDLGFFGGFANKEVRASGNMDFDY